MDNGLVIDRQDEIDRNLAFFLKALPGLPVALMGKYALLRHQTIIDYYDTLPDALKVAHSLYSDKIFSVQQVTDAAAELGFYSHAVHLGAS